MTARELAARRRLLAANATLQRVRLVHDMSALRQAVRPPRWSGIALASVALAAAWWARGRVHHTPAAQTATQTATQTAASVWALRGLTLWRAVRALRRVWIAQQTRH